LQEGGNVLAYFHLPKKWVRMALAIRGPNLFGQAIAKQSWGHFLKKASCPKTTPKL
jgi:hypothetical protein